MFLIKENQYHNGKKIILQTVKVKRLESINNWSLTKLLKNNYYNFKRKNILRYIPSSLLLNAFRTISCWKNYKATPLLKLDKLKKKDNVVEQAYLNKFSKFKINEKNITDKANENFKWIGLIKLFLPNSLVGLNR